MSDSKVHLNRATILSALLKLEEEVLPLLITKLGIENESAAEQHLRHAYLHVREAFGELEPKWRAGIKEDMATTALEQLRQALKAATESLKTKNN